MAILSTFLHNCEVDLEKAFDPWEVVRWAMYNVIVDEWLVRVLKSMCHNVRSCVQVNGGFSDEFEVNVGVHQGSVLSSLLVIMVFDALSMDFKLIVHVNYSMQMTW